MVMGLGLKKNGEMKVTMKMEMGWMDGLIDE